LTAIIAVSDIEKNADSARKKHNNNIKKNKDWFSKVKAFKNDLFFMKKIISSNYNMILALRNKKNH
jgi:hypothetical protein